MSGAPAPESINRRVWRMAGPIVLANATVPLPGFVDTAMAGRLDDPVYLGAVGLGTMVFNVLLFAFNCLRMGTTGPTAIARGAGDHAETRAMLWRALLLGAVIGAVVVALQLPIVAIAFWAVEGSQATEAFAADYLLVRIWAIPAALGVFAITGWYFGLENGRIPLLLQIVINSLHIGLDLLFVLGFGWGIEGIAAASIISQGAGLLLGLFCVARTLRRMPAQGRSNAILDWHRIGRMLKVNTDIFLRTICVVACFAYFTAKGAALGDGVLNVNQVLHQFIYFAAFASDGLAQTAEALVGEAIGRRDRAAFAKAVRAAFVWSFVIAGLLSLFFFLAGPELVALMTIHPEVRELATEYLPWAALMPLFGVAAYTHDGIYLGAVRTRLLRDTMVIAALFYFGLVQVLVPWFDNHGLWAAIAALLLARGAILTVTYPRLVKAVF